MKTFGNIIWHFPFWGFLFALGYAIGGLLACLTIIGIPVGLGLFQFSQFLLSPFSKAMVTRNELELIDGNKQGDGMKGFSCIVRILYFPFGLIAAIGAICTIIVEFITIIGIPSGLVWSKSLSTIFNPVNKVCVPIAVADRIEAIKNGQTVSQYSNEQVVPNLPTHQTNPSPASANQSMIEKAEKKTDDELKEIVRAKEDYNPDLVKAAEAVLLSRITGIPLENPHSTTTDPVTPLTSPNPSIAYRQTQSDVNADFTAGAQMFLGALALPVLTSVINTLNSIFAPLPNSIIPAAVVNFLSLIAGILLIAGALKMFPARKGKPRAGLVLIIIAGVLSIIATIHYSYSSYLESKLWEAYDTIPGAFDFEAISLYNNIGNLVLYFHYIAIISGVIVWQKECINMAAAKQGAFIIAAAQALFLVILILFFFNIYIEQKDHLRVLLMIYPLILNGIVCFGLYKIAVGMNLKKR